MRLLRAASADSAPGRAGGVDTGRSFLLPDQQKLEPMRVLGTLLPVVYVWCLPLLAAAGFAHRCPGYPRCEGTGASVSDFIANAHATGAMAACFFFPCLHAWLNALHVRCDGTGASVSDFIANAHATGAMADCFFPCLHAWLNALHVRRRRWIYPTLVTFQLLFGAFLTCPVTEVPTLHAVAVMLFCASAVTHYLVLMGYCAGERLKHCQVLVAIAICSFFMVGIITAISRVDDSFGARCPMLFYCCECCGLSSMALFPLLWYRERHSAELSRNTSVDSGQGGWGDPAATAPVARPRPASDPGPGAGGRPAAPAGAT